jgi:DNA-binding NtrC family response regulator
MSSHILVLDDYEDTVSMFKIYLQQKGWIVCSFNDSLETYNYFKYNSGKIGLLLTDIRMPGMSGIELASKCKEVNPHIQIIFLTLFEKTEVEDELRKYDLQDEELLQKPIRLNQLQECVEKHLRMIH